MFLVAKVFRLSLSVLYFWHTIGETDAPLGAGDKVEEDLRFWAPACGFCAFESLGDVDSAPIDELKGSFDLHADICSIPSPA